MWGYYNYSPTKPRDPSAALEKLRKKNPNIQPVIFESRKSAKSWWAKAWNNNLESYADYSNRIGRGRSYVRSGAVLDLSIVPGKINAIVQGSRVKPYDIEIQIDRLSQAKWETIVGQCSHKIAGLEALVSGQFPPELAELFTKKGGGLFPSPKEIHFNCSCPDWAFMCKHIAAVLYGIGVRFDNDPTLLFLLRDIDFTGLLKKSVEEKMNNMLKNAGVITKRVMSDVDTRQLFGV